MDVLTTIKQSLRNCLYSMMSAPTAGIATSAPVTVFSVSYLNREKHHLERERSGELTAHYIVNDGSDQSGKFLIGLKTVFSRCLPNMPKEYICRLLFERRHRSVVIVRNGSTVIGGITYRPFHSQNFAEIAFCAIAQSLQVSGYGTRLMNWTKQYARKMDACEYFLTYADNNAVGYFSKQGFTKTITMEKSRWHGFIKDYDGGTLMECHIHPSLPFTSIPDMLAVQREALENEVRKFSSGHIVYSGVSRWKEHEVRTSYTPESASIPEALQELVDKQKAKAAEHGMQYVPPAMPPHEFDWSSRPGPIDTDAIVGLKEAGWSPITTAGHRRCRLLVNGSLVEATKDNLEAFMHMMVEKLKAHDDSWPFRAPVNAWEVLDYYSVVTDPIDLTGIEKRVQNGNYYLTIEQFGADVGRMFDNARKYNSPDTIFYKLANRLQNIFKGWLRESVIYDIIL